MSLPTTTLSSPATAHAALRDALRAEEGWSLADVAAWLASEGRRIVDPAALTTALCERLRAVGAPLWRMRLAFRTLHPQVAAFGYTWTAGTGVEVFPVPHGIEQSDTFIGSPMQQIYERGQPFRRRLDDPARPPEHPILRAVAQAGGIDYLALPVAFSDGTVNGGLVVVTDRAAGFTDADVTAFTALVEFLAPILEAAAMRHVARSLLDTYVGHRTGERVLHGRIRRGDADTIHAAIWFSDLRDFTGLTETLEPDRLLLALNAYFELVAAAVTPRGGEILRFIGDAMLVVFPAEAPVGVREACAAALDAALDAFDRLAELNRRRAAEGEPPIAFGLGLHVGEVVYGNVGAPDRLDFTVIGPAVNRTARLESLTKRLDSPLLVSREFVDVLGCPARSLGAHAMQGVAGVQEVLAPAAGSPLSTD